MGTELSEVFSHVLNDGIPQRAQHRIRIAHGAHACAVWPAVYLYFHSAAGTADFTSPSRSDRRRNRSFGCHTYRRKSAVQITEKTPASTSVMRWNEFAPEA